MSHNSVDKLVKMANQIGKFFSAQKHSDAAAGTAEHLKKFWDPRMRTAITDHVNQGGGGLDPVPLAAVKSLASAKKN
jgi:formate dehydrogenase subunit delta